MVYRYDEEEWAALIAPTSGDWSRGETDYLLDLASQLDLRWVVIADRYHVGDGCRVGLCLGLCDVVLFVWGVWVGGM
jgi:hypothetical protein